MVEIDRHRMARLIELSALEPTLQGFERELKEEEVKVLIKAAYDDATDAARTAFMARVKQLPTSAWPWSAVQAMTPRPGATGGLGGIAALGLAPRPGVPRTPALLLLLRGQAEQADGDPGDRLPERGTPEGLEWELFFKALDDWNTASILKSIGPQGWLSPMGSPVGQVPKDTGNGATSGMTVGEAPPPSTPGTAPPAEPAPASSPMPESSNLPAPQPEATPAVPWMHPAVLAAGATVAVAAGVFVYTLGQRRSLRRLDEALDALEDQP